MIEWTTSSYSTGNGACVQKGKWTKSSYSADSADSADSVETSERLCHGVPIRDSKDPDGSVLLFSHESWAEFLQAIKGGQFN